ncbi:Ankyrin-2 [Xylographa soralifera]|nr:Ankyrin-2 [Xylographa soralifera]
MTTDYEPLLAACTSKDLKEAERLFLQQDFADEDERNKTLMKMACIAAESSLPQLLEFCFKQGVTIALESLNSPLLHAATSAGSIPVYQVLVDNHFDLNQHWSEYDGDALVMAAFDGNVELTRFLLEHGMDPNSGNGCGEWIALFWSIAGRHRSIPLLKLLIEYGVQVERLGATVLAAENDSLEALQLLVQHGAGLEELGQHGVRRDEEQTKLLGTPLFTACKMGFLEMVNYLLDQGANARFINGAGETPYSVAKANGHNRIAELLKDRGLAVPNTNENV